MISIHVCPPISIWFAHLTASCLQLSKEVSTHFLLPELVDVLMLSSMSQWIITVYKAPMPHCMSSPGKFH